MNKNAQVNKAVGRNPTLTPRRQRILDALSPNHFLSTTVLAKRAGVEKMQAASALYDLRAMGYIESRFAESNDHRELQHIKLEERAKSPQGQDGLARRARSGGKKKSSNKKAKDDEITFEKLLERVAEMESMFGQLVNDLLEMSDKQQKLEEVRAALKKLEVG